jgi:predicted secreted protein
MSWTSMLAIYALVWSISAFFVLPFHGRRPADDAVPLIAGQEHGAPSQVCLGRIAIQVTIVSALFFGLFYIAFTQGWADPNVIAGRD